MRKTCAVILGLLLLWAGHPPCAGFNRAQAVSPAAGKEADDNEADELVLVGAVTKIFPLSTFRSRTRWAVVMRVDAVKSGKFSGPTFTFNVHSPAQAGLRVKGVYVIKAAKLGSGYVVNESAIEEVRPAKPRRPEGAAPRAVSSRAGRR